MTNAAAVAADSAPSVHVEVMLLRCESGGRVAFRTVAAPLSGLDVPDGLAAQLCGDAGRPSVLHSTSWRFVPGHGVVLTYVALPDPEPAAPAVALIDPSVVSSGDPLRPAPHELHLHHVAAHAIHHLYELAQRDPAVRAAAQTTTDPSEKDLWRRVGELASRMPTGTHADAHAAARTTGPIADPLLSGAAGHRT